MEKIYELLRNNKIIYLNLKYNNLKNIDKLSKCLKYNSSLTILCLGNNKIKNIDKLYEYLKYNSTLKTIQIYDNKINKDDINKLKEIYKNIFIGI